MKILRIRYENLPLFVDGKLDINFMAMDRVVDKKDVCNIYRNIYTENVLSFVGINATGKTTALKLINFALQIMIGCRSINEVGIIDRMILNNETRLIVDFFNKGKFYQLQSNLGMVYPEHGPVRMIYKEEKLFSKDKSTVTSRKQVFDYSDEDNVDIKVRSQLNPEALAYLKDEDSIVISEIKDNGSCVQNVMQYTDHNISNVISDVPESVLQVFDPSLEYIKARATKSGFVWNVKFKNKSEDFFADSAFLLNQFISSGTIKGQNIFAPIIAVLKVGGYFIIDELENHLNKELVRVIIDIFNNSKTNPNGACLIFTTHYAEILDFLDRKDNIYVTKKEKFDLLVFNYAEKIKRNDIKKSEVILSNYLKGTAPLYESIKQLKESVCELVKK